MAQFWMIVAANAILQEIRNFLSGSVQIRTASTPTILNFYTKLNGMYVEMIYKEEFSIDSITY